MKTCVFEYLYRDAGNFKVLGELLLVGSFTESDKALVERACEDSRLFVAEQIDVPTLYEELYQFSGGPTEDDMAFHEFLRFRETQPDDLKMKPWGTVAELIERFQNVNGNWNYRLSPHSGFGFL